MKNQKGMTFIGMLLTAAIVVFGGVTVMKVVPVYIEHYTILKSIKSLKDMSPDELSGSPAMVAMNMYKKFSKVLYVNGINEFERKDFKVRPTREGYLVSVRYNAERHIVSNMYMLFKFEDDIKVTR